MKTIQDIKNGLFVSDKTPDTENYPLISFKAIYDYDIGLVNLIRKSYLNDKVFNKEFFTKPMFDIIREIYVRKDLNPLKVFALSNIPEKDLDDYLNQFLEIKRKEILDLSVGTEMINVIDSFNDSNEIKTTLLYYNDDEKNILENESKFNNNKKISIDTINNTTLRKYTQIYIKEIDELKYFQDMPNSTTFYISTFGPNLDREFKTIKKSDYLVKLLDSFIPHQISIFDLYDKNKIGAFDYYGTEC